MISSRLIWSELDPKLQRSLSDKLRGIYDFEADDGEVFDWLTPDKQRALKLLVARFVEVNLWRFVLRVTNVYGKGGMGCEFLASDDLLAEMRCRRDFTSRFANHTDAHYGFYERHRPRLALHFLLMDHAKDVWSAHSDLRSPVASPASLVRHLWHERFRGSTPAA